MDGHSLSRRAVLRSTLSTVAAGSVAGLAGCTGDNDCEVDGAAKTIAVGPGESLVFDPETVQVDVGDTVGWCFQSRGHNVSAVPDHSDEVSIPEDAEPFASYEGDNQFQTVAVGETFTHTFETAGRYTYVCVPHVNSGMVGTVVVG